MRTREQPPTPSRDALRLSPRELQVLELIAHGYHDDEIARMLSVSEETVKTHVRKLLGKLRAANRTHAVGRAFRLGLLE